MSGAHGPGTDHAPAPGLAGRAALASVATALFLLGLKGYAAWATGSVAMLGSLADTGLDLVASLVTLFAVRYAAMPADEDHRFGHGKAEALSALFQVMLIAASALAIGWRAIERLMNGAATAEAEYGIAVSAIAMAATFALLAYQQHVIRRTGSVAIAADHVHYQSDLLLNGAVIAALALDAFAGFRYADPLFGVAIALWLLWGAWRAAAGALDQLMDKQWPPEREAEFLKVAAEHSALKGIHDFRARTSGSRSFVQFHLWVDPDMSVRAAHDMVDAAEAALVARFPDTEILIHLDPEGQVDDEGTRELPALERIGGTIE